MVRTVLFSLFIIFVGFLLNMFVQSRYKSIKSVSEDIGNRSLFENTQVKVYGKSGVEWIVKGNILEMEKDWVKLQNPVFVSNKGETIKADKGILNRSTGLGKLEGNVLLESQDIYIETDVADVDLKNNLISGEGYVYAKNEDKIIRGKGYVIYLRSQKVIIKNVDTEIR